jgi:hypothetical protein
LLFRLSSFSPIFDFQLMAGHTLPLLCRHDADDAASTWLRLKKLLFASAAGFRQPPVYAADATPERRQPPLSADAEERYEGFRRFR